MAKKLQTAVYLVTQHAKVKLQIMSVCRTIEILRVFFLKVLNTNSRLDLSGIII